MSTSTASPATGTSLPVPYAGQRSAPPAIAHSKLADQTIGFTTANAILGHDANATPIGGIGSGVLFAFVSGLAGSFTACNIAAFGAMGPLVGRADGGPERFLATLRPLGWLAAFVLRSIGNILVMSVLFLLLSYVAGRPLSRWLGARPGRASVLTALAFVIGGVFLVCYWDLRVLARVGYLWFPPSPW